MNETKYGFLKGVPIDPDPSMPDGQKRWEIVPISGIVDSHCQHFSSLTRVWNPVLASDTWAAYVPTVIASNPDILAFRRPITPALKEAGAGSLETVQSKAREWLKELPAFNTHGENVALHCARRHLAELTQLRTLAKHITHPQIHVDYYEWLGGLSDFDRNFLQTASPTGIAMWAWSLSRERLTLIAKLKGEVGE